MKNEKAIELLEEASANLWSYTSPNVSITNTHISDNKKLIDQALALLAEPEKLHGWIPADEPPENMDWDEKVLVLEYESEIPIVMTMAEVFLNEGSEAEYWKPIILPESEKPKC